MADTRALALPPPAHIRTPSQASAHIPERIPLTHHTTTVINATTTTTVNVAPVIVIPILVVPAPATTTTQQDTTRPPQPSSLGDRPTQDTHASTHAHAQPRQRRRRVTKAAFSFLSCFCIS